MFNMDVQNINEDTYERCSRKSKKKSGKKPIIIFTSPKGRTRPMFFGICLALAKFLVSMQEGGGPTGLRGTCAIARLMMQIFDVKWEGALRELCVQIWLNSRYMDDGRTAMPPLKPGWRWVEQSLQYCIRWEREDQELTSEEITKKGILGTLNNVEDFLRFTVETEEDFPDKWLPTLDMKLKVSGSNQVLHDFFVKPTSSNVTVQRRTAMGEDAKIQILSNDLIRRLKNSSEELGGGAKVEIVNNYAQKLMNSGYKGEQLH